MHENPYAPSQAATMAPPVSQAEAIRNQFLRHEASVKSVGSLYLLGAIFLLILAIGIGTRALGNGPDAAIDAAMAALAGVMGVAYFFIGQNLRKLVPWTRVVGIVLSCLGLLGFPIGTILSAYILWLFASQKGAYVFSPEYKQVIAETPHIKYRSKVFIVFLIAVGVILLLFVLMGLVAFLAKRATNP